MEPEYLSVSRLNAYLICPRKYRFRYVDQREPESKSAAMAFGSAVHTAIEWMGRQRLQASQRLEACVQEDQVSTPTVEEVQRIFRADWTAQTAPGDLTFEGKQTAESLQVLGETLVGLFVTRFAQRPFQAVEQRFEVPLIDHGTGEELPVPLLGYIDFIEEDGKVGEIKTAAKKTDPAHNHMWTVQLSGYSYAYRHLHGIDPTIVVVELLKTKTSAIEEFAVRRTTQQEQWFVRLAFEVYRAICNGAFHPIPSWACARCEYRGACRK